jgi:hypothetical protein
MYSMTHGRRKRGPYRGRDKSGPYRITCIYMF